MSTIRKVLAVDGFKINNLSFNDGSVTINAKNMKFRSTAQAVGRIASTLQRFTSDDITIANISFYSQDLQLASYRVDLEKISNQQHNSVSPEMKHQSITAADLEALPFSNNRRRFTWGVGPYFSHRLFNPDLPLSMETGIEVAAGYQLAPGLKISGAIRKSILTNLNKNGRSSNSLLPRVHSDWPLYDIAGQSGHIHNLTLSYVKNLAPGIFGRVQAGLLEPFFAGIGGELLYKPTQWPIGLSVDIYR